MVVFSFGNKLGRVIFAVITAAVLVTVCAVIGCDRRESIPPYAVNNDGVRFYTEISDNDSAVGFMKQFGVSIEKKPVKKDIVTIPADFGEVYGEYNELQKRTGFDLSRFKGCKAERIIYKKKNSGEYVTLLAYKGHVIGGHIGSGEYGEKYRELG
jgi:hypothetical protein